MASELKAADKLKGKGERGCMSQKQGRESRAGQMPEPMGVGGAETRVPEDGYLPIIVARRQELPAG